VVVDEKLPVEELTVEELATQQGTKVSTVRLYQRQGLLPAPTVRGRVAFYGRAHVARLTLIAQLQARGFSLAAIKALIDTWEGGGSIGDLVGLEARVAGANSDETVMSPPDFATLFPEGEIDPELALRSVELGLVQFEDDGNVRVRSRRFLEIGAAVADLGITLPEILDEYATTRAACQELADRFVALFSERVWNPFAARGYPATDAARVASEIDRFRALGIEVVEIAMRIAIDDAATAAFVDEAARLQVSEPEEEPR
jgi:DNA-binding transcriptional MerR regulator